MQSYSSRKKKWVTVDCKNRRNHPRCEYKQLLYGWCQVVLQVVQGPQMVSGTRSGAHDVSLSSHRTRMSSAFFALTLHNCRLFQRLRASRWRQRSAANGMCLYIHVLQNFPIVFDKFSLINNTINIGRYNAPEQELFGVFKNLKCKGFWDQTSIRDRRSLQGALPRDTLPTSDSVTQNHASSWVCLKNQKCKYPLRLFFTWVVEF